MPKHIFLIENGKFGLKLVDTNAVGYTDSWQAPGGKTLDTVTLADYETDSASWSCQIISGALEATPDTTTTPVPATWCEAAENVPTPAKTGFSFNGSFLQDPDLVNGLNRFLFEFDAQEAYLYAGFDDVNPPKLIGRVRLASGTIGGAGRENLTADLALPLTKKPDIEFGDAGSSEIVTGEGGGTTFAATAEESELQPA